ncbi:MAG: hypothetical protein ACK5NT_15355 [Pyrinomonadaceae bacterium]
MKNSRLKQLFGFGIAGFSLVITVGAGTVINAQSSRDPFSKNPVYNKKSAPARPTAPAPNTNPSNPTNPMNPAAPAPVKKTGPQVVEAPSAEARISYFRQVREQAAVNGIPIPKVTSVMLLDELVVTGIFKTPRGYAAMVKATPIELSYPVYPGEKFFDGQLVAVEENRVVFRKVTKWSNGKYVSSVDYKPLRTYTDQQTVQGTVPTESYQRPTTAANTPDPSSGQISSPLEEMNEQKQESTEELAKTKKGTPRKSPKNNKRN